MEKSTFPFPSLYVANKKLPQDLLVDSLLKRIDFFARSRPDRQEEHYRSEKSQNQSYAYNQRKPAFRSTICNDVADPFHEFRGMFRERGQEHHSNETSLIPKYRADSNSKKEQRRVHISPIN